MKSSELDMYHNETFINTLFISYKGQLIPKANCQAVNPSKKRTNEFVFTAT